MKILLSPLRGYLYANTIILHDFLPAQKKCSLKGKSIAFGDAFLGSSYN